MTSLLCRYNEDALCSKVYACHDILTSVTLRDGTCTCQDFADLFDPGAAFWYLDPPYYGAGPRLYQFSFSHDDHVRLAELLRRETRPWLLSYDKHPVILQLYQGWSQIDEVAVGYSIHGCGQKTELLITNHS
jgi:DNA adenine methylase